MFKSICGDRAALLRLLIAVSLLVVTIVCGFICKPEQASEIVRKYGYYNNLILFVGTLIYSGRLIVSYCRRRCQQALSRVHAQFWQLFLIAVVTVCAGATIVLHKAEFDYKILMDDYLLAATAKAMYQTGEVSVAEFGRTIDGEFRVTQSYVDKRPWFYPFLVSITHDLTGYHVKNPFLLNALCACLLLALVFILAYWLAGLPGAVLSVLLWASLPLLQQNATGGGMEMLNLLMLHFVMFFAIIYLRNPSREREGALCLAACLLTYSRYESGLFLGLILFLVLAAWWRERRVFLSWGAVCAAPLLLPVFLQTRIYSGTQSSWELAEGVTAPFALAHFWNNLPHAFVFFWSRDLDIANSLLLGVLALPAVIAFVWVCLRMRGTDWWQRPENQVWALFAVFLLLNLAVVLCFHAAQFDHRYVARYSLPTHMLIVFCALSSLASMQLSRRVWGLILLLVAAFVVCVTLPKNSQALYTRANFMIAEQHWLEALDALYMADDSLIVDRFSTAWTLRERSALPPHTAWAYRERIANESMAGKYGQVFLVERLTISSEGSLRTALPAVASLQEAYRGELLGEKSFRAGNLTRVYRLNL